MQKKYLLIIWVWFYHSSNAQQKNFVIPDSLVDKSYEYFNENIVYNETDSIKEKLYAQSWLAKAKSDKNFGQMALAYKALIYKNDKKSRILYADSLVTAAKRTTDIQLIGSAYMTKGIVHYDRREQMKALDNYLLADQYISRTNDQYLIHKVKFAIGQIKYYLGFYHEAKSLFKECVEYFKEENDRAYLNSLHFLGLCHNRIGEYKRCSQINQLGINLAVEYDISEMIPYFTHSEGVNQYFLHNYKDAISKLTKVLPEVVKNKDVTNETVAYFYIGKSYWSQQQLAKALPFFQKIDEAFQKQNYIRPDLREAYELLINYYQKQNNREQQLYYINGLLKVDKVLNQDYRYLSGKIHKEYDTKKLLEAKLDIEQSMKHRTLAGTGIIVILLVAVAFLIHRHYKNKRLFRELMERKPVTPKSIISGNGSKEAELDINPEVVAAVLKSLEKFENNRKYLEKDMTLVKIASLLNTNTKYVSKIVAKYREKGTIEYISDLKIDHIVELLKSESKYRNYTNKALGEEAGFGSTQNFTRAFNNRTGISPTYFIYQLKKSASTAVLQ